MIILTLAALAFWTILKKAAFRRGNAGEASEASLLSSINNSMSTQTDALDYICARLAAMGNLGDAKDIPGIKIDETGIDSLELTELIMEIEDKFSVEIDDSALSGSTTISELASFISVSQG